MKYYALALFIMIFLCSCAHKTENVREIDDFRIIETEWGMLRNIEFYDDKIFVLDIMADPFIWVYDSDFNELYNFGRKGGGPSELGMPENFVIQDDKIYILDKMFKTIKSYSLDGEYLDYISLEHSFSPISFCIIDDRYYVISAQTFMSSNDFPIQVYDNVGKLVSEFGEKKFKDNSMMADLKNLSMIYAFENKIWQFPTFASSHYYLYHSDGILIEEKELDLPFNIIFNENQKDISEDNIGTLIFNDVVAITNKLWALVGGNYTKKGGGFIYIVSLGNSKQIYYSIDLDSIRNNLVSFYSKMTLVGDEIYITSPYWDFMIAIDSIVVKK